MARRVAVAAILAVAVLIAGCGQSTRPATTSTSGPAASTTRTSQAAVSTTTTPRASASGASLYFLHTGTVDQAGPLLTPVWADGATAMSTALIALLAGPPAPGHSELASPAITTAIPAGTRLLDLSLAGSTATADLSGGFASGGGSTTMLARLAQVVYTATQFPGVQRVAFRLDGRPVTTFSAEGIGVEGGVTRAFFYGSGLLPRILVEQPALGQTVGSQFSLSGIARDVPGARFTYELTRGGEDRLAQGTVTTSSERGWATFRQTVTFVTATAPRQRIDLVVFAGTAASPAGLLQIPFYLQAGA